ncbi:DNA-binding response regulator, LuxR family protein [Candidatus Promineifilum breve]|uniref:DNA-binding response regulator, LuxR family protein n=1 Tax=Candidatus Promineifilum breve TaxID=1806508 RepID=A0A160SYF4_9CHLR|nr:response regulator transcription factor [Candidatus Promineifilum breve]CUS02084.2 DNA-binding response regulator, LuxR family protein [Candidatus Promineifilum breve]
MIRVVIADDHHLVRQGLRALLESNPEVKVIGEAATGFEAVEQAEKLTPDVIVMDLSMPRLDGVQAAARILELNAPIQIVIVSMHADTAVIHNLVRRGVKGYLLKDALADELMLAIRSAAAGKLYLSPTISESVMNMLVNPQRNEDGAATNPLTEREQEVLQLVAEGHTSSAIAQILSISVKTVEKHRANIMTKLDAADLATLIRVAIKRGYIFLDT